MPGMILGLMSNRDILAKRGAISKMAIEIGVISAVLCLGLPAAIGMFTSKGKIDEHKIEREFWNKTLPNGKMNKKFYFNRGL